MRTANFINTNRSTHSDMAFALKQAWWFESFRDAINNGFARFTYFKKDGTTRTALGTRSPSLIPTDKLPKGDMSDGAATWENNVKAIPYFDLEKMEWRSFDVLNFVSLDRVWRFNDIGILESIPLTPEILEKNGIKLSYTYTHPYRDGEWEEGELEEAMKHYPMYVYQTLNPRITFVIRPNEQELKVCSSNYNTTVEKKEKVLFVHELQHALRLCGIDKEIVL